MFESDPALEGYVTAADGHIYSVPQRMPNRPATRYNMFINRDWLDVVGMDAPRTTDEFRDVLRAFKENDPNGNGKADELPLMFNGMNNNSGVNNLFGAFGLADNTNGDWIHLENGSLSYSLADERVKDAVHYLHGLHTDGAFTSENFTRQWGQMVALFRTPDVAIVGVGFHWTIGAAMNNAERATQYEALTPLVGPNGDRLWRPSTIMTVNPVAFAMPVGNPAKAQTMAYVDQFYDPTVGVELYFGPVGTTLDQGADGTYTVMESTDPDLTQDAWLWKYGMNDLSPVYFSEEFEQRIVLSYPDEKAEIDAVFAPYAARVDEFPPFLQYTPAEIQELSVLKAEINDFATETTSQWIMNGNIDAEWDSYQRQLEAMGLQRMLEIYSAAYQRYLWN
jgi:putative aldouronate transport system substrate-binding protein